MRAALLAGSKNTEAPSTTGIHEAVASEEPELKALLNEIQRHLKDLTSATPRRSTAKVLLSKRQAAAMLGVSRGPTLETLIATKRLKSVKVNGRLRIPASEISRLAEEGFDTDGPVPVTRRAKPNRARGGGDDVSRILSFKTVKTR